MGLGSIEVNAIREGLFVKASDISFAACIDAHKPAVNISINGKYVHLKLFRVKTLYQQNLYSFSRRQHRYFGLGTRR